VISVFGSGPRSALYLGTDGTLLKEEIHVDSIYGVNSEHKILFNKGSDGNYYPISGLQLFAGPYPLHGDT
jgi:hypothetical protein